jgi:hypothetical protein
MVAAPAVAVGDSRRDGESTRYVFSVAGLPGCTPVGRFDVVVPRFGGDGGPASSANLAGPGGLLALGDGSFLIADSGNHRVRRVDRYGRIRTVAGNGVPGFSGDGGPARRAQLYHPQGLALARDGSVLVADASNNRVRRIAPSGIITTVAGNGSVGAVSQGARASETPLEHPEQLAATSDGSIYIVTGNAWSGHAGILLHRTAADGTITTVAGGGSYRGPRADGRLGVDARLAPILGIAAFPRVALLISDGHSNRVRALGIDGRLSTRAGIGSGGIPGGPPTGDGGPAVRAQFDQPASLATRPDGSFLVSDRLNGVVREVSTRGIIRTVAGNARRYLDAAFRDVNNPPPPRYVDHRDGGPARSALFRPAGSIALARDGDLLVVDPAIQAVRLVASPRTKRLAIAISRIQTRANRLRRITYRTSLPARVVLRVHARGRTVLTHTARTTGARHIRVPSSISRGPYRVTATARANGRVATACVSP